MRLTIANAQAIKYACLKFHYAKCVPVNPIGFNVYNDADEWCGVILYSLGANPNLGNFVNLGSGEVVELTRVALNGKQGNGKTSQAISMSLKMLREKCPLVRLVVSFADCDQSHLGTIYQATNWVYVGHTDFGDTKFLINGKIVHRKTIHSRLVVINGKKVRCPETLECVRKYICPTAELFRTKGKRKYLMPLDKRMRKQILPMSKPYPKNEGWVKIDRAQFHKETPPTE